MEMVELFANQAAIAIDSARIFQEREAERVALEEAIVLLRQDLEQVQHGDLRVRVQSSHQKLQPVVEAMNVTIKEISEILGSVQMVTQAVDEHAQRCAAEFRSPGSRYCAAGTTGWADLAYRR